jgi:phosphoribosylanthranilate isomerase
VRVVGDVVPDSAAELFGVADAVVLDARVPGALGGTGVPIQWARIAGVIAGIRARGRLVLAGGLSPGNVEEAVAALHPDIVDVSSGVESASGVKDHARMRAFFRAARGESA